MPLSLSFDQMASDEPFISVTWSHTWSHGKYHYKSTEATGCHDSSPFSPLSPIPSANHPNMDSLQKHDQVTQGNAVVLQGFLGINAAAGSSELAPEAAIDNTLKRLNEVVGKQRNATKSLNEAVQRFRGVMGRLRPSPVVVCVFDRFSRSTCD